MNQLNTLGQPKTAKSTAELSAEGLINAIVAEVERLQSERFCNTVTCDSLLFNHSTWGTCDSVYLDEVLAKLGPEFPAVELDEEIIQSRNEFGKVERSTVSGVEVETRLNRLQQQQEMILKNNFDLKSQQVNQQREMILDLQQNNLDLNSQVKKQQELILELQKPLNTVNEFHQWNVQTLKDERLKSQNTQTHQEQTTAELTDRVQIDIAEIDDAITTNGRSSLTDSCQMDQLQDVERVQSSAEDVERMEDDAEQDITSAEGEPEQAIPSHKEDNLNQIERSLWTKQVNRKVYSCAECNKQCKQKGDLTKHFRIHTGEKPYNCEDCGAAFSQSSSLRNHQRIHSGEKPYGCKKCGVAFSQLGSLRSHQRSHSDERPFICEICNKSFKRKSILSSHIMAVHSAKRPHQCIVCDKKFSLKSNLVRHFQLHS